MARGINKAILVGHVGQDPEVKYLQSGGEVTNISVATAEQWKDKQTGDKKERTEWHRVVFFNQLAKIAGEYLHKGSQVYIEGSIRTRKWQDQNGQDHYTTEVVANNMQMLGSRSSDQSQGGNQQSYAPSNQSAGGEQGAISNREPLPQADAFDFVDDIPF